MNMQVCEEFYNHLQPNESSTGGHNFKLTSFHHIQLMHTYTPSSFHQPFDLRMEFAALQN